jgi:hypothetical protein
MIRFAVRVVVASLAGATLGCITTINPVVYKRDTGAPVMPERPEGCVVEIFDENQTAPRAVKVLGRIELAWSQDQVQEQGQEYAMKTLKTAACEQGGHYILNMRALPRGFRQGMLFEGDLAVIVDDAGVPLQGVATGTSSSSDGVHVAPSASTSTVPAVAPRG